MMYVTGNKSIPCEDRMYSLLTWIDTGDQELIWGLGGYKKPEGTYCDLDTQRLYSIKHFIAL